MSVSMIIGLAVTPVAAAHELYMRGPLEPELEQTRGANLCRLSTREVTPLQKHSSVPLFCACIQNKEMLMKM